MLDGVSLRLGPETDEERIALLAARQRGRVSRGQLIAAGIGSAAIDRRRAAGRLILVHRAVFAVGHLGPIPLADETAALLAMRDGAALSHHSAAARWGLAPARDLDGRVHVTVPGSPGGLAHGVTRHRSVILAPADIRIRDRLPVTSPERTILDLAATGSPRETERNVDHALRTTPMTLDALTQLLKRAGRHHGRRPLIELLEHRAGADTFTRSEAEERFLALIRAAGLPEPLVNCRRHGYEIDFLWPQHGVAIEVDGFATHGDRGSFERDRRKGMDLRAAGIELSRVSWRLIRDESLYTVARIGQILGSRVTVSAPPTGENP